MYCLVYIKKYLILSTILLYSQENQNELQGIKIIFTFSLQKERRKKRENIRDANSNATQKKNSKIF